MAGLRGIDCTVSTTSRLQLTLFACSFVFLFLVPVYMGWISIKRKYKKRSIHIVPLCFSFFCPHFAWMDQIPAPSYAMLCYPARDHNKISWLR